MNEAELKTKALANAEKEKMSRVANASKSKLWDPKPRTP